MKRWWVLNALGQDESEYEILTVRKNTPSEVVVFCYTPENLWLEDQISNEHGPFSGDIR